jgi:hypothetical protein
MCAGSLPAPPSWTPLPPCSSPGRNESCFCASEPCRRVSRPVPAEGGGHGTGALRSRSPKPVLPRCLSHDRSGGSALRRPVSDTGTLRGALLHLRGGAVEGDRYGTPLTHHRTACRFQFGRTPYPQVPRWPPVPAPSTARTSTIVPPARVGIPSLHLPPAHRMCSSEAWGGGHCASSSVLKAAIQPPTKPMAIPASVVL